MGSSMKQMAARALAGLVVVVALVYIGDWGLWRVRVARGGGHGVVQVNQFLSSALKGNKVEYDWMGRPRWLAACLCFLRGATRLAGGWSGIRATGSKGDHGFSRMARMG